MWYVSDGDCACYEIFCVQHFVHLFAMLVNMYVFIQHTMKTLKKKKDEFKIWDSTLNSVNIFSEIIAYSQEERYLRNK